MPYTDPNAVGTIGLCDQAGQQVTSGSIDTTPFAWRAVSSQSAPAPYDNAGRTATLYVFQPIQGLPPGVWSGVQLTASSRYTNLADPMAAATDRDDSLEDAIAQYPPNWDGFLELRIYLGTTNDQPYSLHYPALDIQVSGGTWQAVGGGPVNCSSGTSESIESIVLPSTTTTSSPLATTGSGGGTSGGGNGASGGTASRPAGGGKDPSGTKPTGTNSVDDRRDSSTSSDRGTGTSTRSDAHLPADIDESPGIDYPRIVLITAGTIATLSAAVYGLSRRRHRH